MGCSKHGRALELGRLVRGWSDTQPSEKCDISVGTNGEDFVSSFETSGFSTGAIVERASFVSGGVGGGGGGGGDGVFGISGGCSGSGGAEKKGGGRSHHSVTTGGAAGFSSGTAIPGSTRDGGLSRHGAFGGGDGIFKYLVGCSGAIRVDVGETGHPLHSGVTGGADGSSTGAASLVSARGGGGHHGNAAANK